MTIDWETQPDTDPGPKVEEGRGWRRVTPQHGARWYEDCAPDDDRWSAVPGQKFTSVTECLRAGFPTDWSGPTRWNQARWTWANRGMLMAKPEAEAIKAMVDSSGITLTEAANRGSGVHAYVEARLQGIVPDWEYIASVGAGPWIGAVEKFLDDVQPEPMLIETVAFDRTAEVAGTLDALVKFDGLVTLVDWKSRAKQHDRRGKEAAQLGAYATMLTGHYFFDERGRRAQIERVDQAVIITFCPDGTWQPQFVELQEGIDAYECALQMRERSKVGRLYRPKVGTSEPFDGNARLVDALALIPDTAPEKARLADAWKAAGLPKASEGQVSAAQYGEAMALIHLHGGRWQPLFTGPEPKPTNPYAKPDDIRERVTERIRKLPNDLQAQVYEHAVGLPEPSSLAMTVADLDDWDRYVTLAEGRHQDREVEIGHLCHLISTVGLDLWAFIEARFPDPRTWTSLTIDLVAAIWKAADENHVDMFGDDLCVNVYSATGLIENTDGGKRSLVKRAKELAKKFGLTKPSKWDDLMADPILYAAVVAA